MIAVSDDAENAIIVVPGANAALDDREVEAVESLTVGDVLLLQLEVPLPVVCRAARRAAARGVRVVINIAPYAALPADVIALADPVIANEHEAVALAESGAVPGSLLVTYGANGTSWNGRTWSAHSVPRHQVLDTTGAGDAFCGALAAALALGHDESHAMDAALAAGASAVRRVGVEVATELSAELLRGGAPGLQFFTLNRSRATAAILANLRRLGLDRRTPAAVSDG